MTNITDQTVIESREGTTAVEVYRAAGADFSPEAREEAFQIANSLGLDKQEAAYKSEVSILQWPVMTAEQQAVYLNCFPRQVELKNYDNPLPLSVLREAEALTKIRDDDANTLKVFRMVVLCPDTAHDPDPVLIARIGPGHEWDAKWHIIARWGSALMDFDDLRDIAKTRILDAIASARSELDHAANMMQTVSPSRWPSQIASWDTTHQPVKLDKVIADT